MEREGGVMFRVGNRLRSTLSLGAVLALVSLMGLWVPGASASHELCFGYSPDVWGTEGDDELYGTPENDIILALGGNDTVRGLEGNDFVCGGDGDDLVYGGAGTDYVDGGPGYDYCDFTDANGSQEGEEVYSDECESTF
jgi:Ca2+-binding RTX toxin-like protein